MCCSNRFPFGILWGLGLVVASLGIATTVAHGAPRGACQTSTAKRVAQLGGAAENAQATGKTREAWRAIRDAVTTARRGGCQKHRSLGRAYLVLGIIEHGNGRWTRMYSAWQKALRLDRTLVLDGRFTNLGLRSAFRRLKKKLFPLALRPRARPLPRPRPADPPVTPPRPLVGQPPTTPSRPVARPAPSPAPNPNTRIRTAGCSTDNDCKGNRVCDRGHCVYPRYSGTRAPVVTPVRRYPRHAAPVPPLPPKNKPRYSKRGNVELGLGVGLQYDSISTKTDGYSSSSSKVQYLQLSLDVYVGYFVADRFKLGFYFSVPFSKTSQDGSDDIKNWEVDLIGAPGFAIPFGPTLFGFVDFLVGFAVRGGDTGLGENGNDNIVMGLVGGEFGLKVLLGTHLIMKIGVKPLYLFGKITSGYSNDDNIEVNDVRVVLTLGFSAFW